MLMSCLSPSDGFFVEVVLTLDLGVDRLEQRSQVSRHPLASLTQAMEVNLDLQLQWVGSYMIPGRLLRTTAILYGTVQMPLSCLDLPAPTRIHTSLASRPGSQRLSSDISPPRKRFSCAGARKISSDDDAQKPALNVLFGVTGDRFGQSGMMVSPRRQKGGFLARP